jgi:hypothetical protein
VDGRNKSGHDAAVPNRARIFVLIFVRAGPSRFAPAKAAGGLPKVRYATHPEAAAALW